MLSLHLTGSLWFLLLLPPGFFILWRQYRHGSGQDGPPSSGLILFGLQAAALLLLTLSLAAPELRRHRVEFHNPAVLILRDRSGSFRNGGYLGLGGSYARFEKKLSDSYRARNFDVKVADFQEQAWPVAGFPKQGRSRPASEPADSVTLTSLATAADFVDSASIPNLQAIFLFSDGRANLDSGKASRTWSAPLYPVVLAPDSIGEVQPEQVSIAAAPAHEGAAIGNQVDVAVAYRPVGGKAGEVFLRLLQDGKVLLNRKWSAGDGAKAVHFAWTPDKSVTAGKSPVRAILQPAESGANFDPYNDTVTAVFPGGRNQRVIYVLRPIRSLDEKGMLDILSAGEGVRVTYFGMDELAKLPLTARDQVWMEAGSLTDGSLVRGSLQGGPMGALKTSGAKVVIYTNPGSERGRLVLPGLSGTWREFSPGAEIKVARNSGVAKSAAEAFPDEVVRVKGLTQSPVDAPEPASGASPLVEVGEGGKRAMLMGRISLAPGKKALFFVLPRIWSQLFDPQADFATRGNIAAYIRAAQAMADFEDGTIQVTRPVRVFDRVPFEMAFRLPEPENEDGKLPAGKPGALLLVITGHGSTRELPPDARENPNEPAWKSISLQQGAYRLALRKGVENLWSDTLLVAPKAALELAHIGFDLSALEDAASRSGGRVLTPKSPASTDTGASGSRTVAPSGGDSDWVTSVLPTLPNAQIRMEKTQSYRLYNTLSLFIATLLLLSLSWLLRKKWDID